MTNSGVAVRRCSGTPPRPPAQVVRGALVGTVSGVGAWVAHQLAGGHAVTGISMVVMMVAVSTGVAAARWRVGLASAVGLASSAQAVSHLLMSGFGHPNVHAQMTDTSAMPHTANGSGASAMLLSHFAVVVATALLIRGADQTVLDLVWVMTRWFLPRTWLPRLPLPQQWRFTHVIDARHLPSLFEFMTPLTRRGPPVLTRLFSTSP